jgi:mono/diheme cytochrome c family protein
LAAGLWIGQCDRHGTAAESVEVADTGCARQEEDSTPMIPTRFSSLFASALVAVGLALPAFGLALQAGSSPAAAQEFDEQKVRRGKSIFANKGNCFYCHGWAGDGLGNPQSDLGPSLRTTVLNREQLAEVINCGRPAARMPAHDRMAYTDDRCYGVTGDDLGPDRPPQAFNTLAAREVDAVVEYLLAKVVGRGKPTREECLDYFGEGTAACDQYAQ